MPFRSMSMRRFAWVLVMVVWRLVPETKGRSLEEIERSWSRQR